MSNIDNIISLLNHFSNSEESSDLGELGEQDDAAAAPAAASGGGEGYPPPTKWESGVTRGPANQIGLTKWADIVKINRGKANTLY
jgi:hypothetical protein